MCNPPSFHLQKLEMPLLVAVVLTAAVGSMKVMPKDGEKLLFPQQRLISKWRELIKALVELAILCMVFVLTWSSSPSGLDVLRNIAASLGAR